MRTRLLFLCAVVVLLPTCGDNICAREIEGQVVLGCPTGEADGPIGGVDGPGGQDGAADAPGPDAGPCSDGAIRSCYTGPNGTENHGVCAAGEQLCTGGVFGPCVGQVLPAAEACNGDDDDCDDATDEDLGTLACGIGACRQEVAACATGMLGVCTPGAPSAELCNGIDDDCDGPIDEDGCGCFYVSPSGDDANPGTGVNPVRTITQGIALAVASPTIKRVCVGAVVSGPSCAFDYDEAVTMAPGVSVLGSYKDNNTAAWPRTVSCGGATGGPPCFTRILAQDAQGVRFAPTATATTVLDGLYIYSQGGTGVRRAVTVEGSPGVISNTCINVAAGPTPPPLPTGDEIYGIDVVAAGVTPATPVITRNIVNGLSGLGGGTTVIVRGAAVRVTASAPEIINNGGGAGFAPACGSINAACSGAPGDVGELRGPATATGESYGVWLVDASATRVEHNTIYGGGAFATAATAAGVRIQGDAEGVILRDSCVWGGTTAGGAAHGVWVTGCTGSTPWVVGNDYIVAGSNQGVALYSSGVYIQGECPVAIEQNNLISGGNKPASITRGVSCEPQDPTDPASPGALCSVQRNRRILGSCGFAMTDAVGVYCGPRSCRDITGHYTTPPNAAFPLGIEAFGTFGDSRGIVLDRTGPVVDGNYLTGACGSGFNVGADLADSWARLTNNVIRAGLCTAGSAGSGSFYGVRQANGPGLNEPDVHSNSIDAGLGIGMCNSRAVGLTSGSAGGSPRGVYRNNVLRATNNCVVSRYGFEEVGPLADPRIVENNDFFDAPTGLYRDEGTTSLMTPAEINALDGVDGVVVNGNISGDPGYAVWPFNVHLGPGASVCRGAGTATGAPLVDLDGDTRPAPAATSPDIGADEDAL